MLRSGIPEEIALALRSVSASYRGWGAPVEVTRPLADGDVVELAGRTASKSSSVPATASWTPSSGTPSASSASSATTSSPTSPRTR